MKANTLMTGDDVLKEAEAFQSRPNISARLTLTLTPTPKANFLKMSVVDSRMDHSSALKTSLS